MDYPESNEARLGPQGRLVIPAKLRRALHLKTGDCLLVRQDGESIVLERQNVVERRLRARFSHIPDKISLVDELLAERRADAARESDK
jgi:AbrB family looped-hinge helix DNA binding protein